MVQRNLVFLGLGIKQLSDLGAGCVGLRGLGGFWERSKHPKPLNPKP